MMLKSFYWHDYETSGTDPALDWPAQFAGIRTDAELNETGEPLNIFCKQPLDHLPHPMAALVTGLSPQEVNARGVIEPEFIRQIHHELMQPGTCGAGYNSLRFDDEVTRHSLYRNFYDPYAREWKNGNSRWDLIDMVRLAGALRPDGIEWPSREDGFKSFRLEELTAANGIAHDSAHDALSDVRATIALARLVRDRQPALFKYVLDLRHKHKVSELLNLTEQKMRVHVSGMFGAHRNNLAIIMPLANHPGNKNGVIVYDLATDPELLLDLSVDEIRQRVFTAVDELPEGMERIPLKTIHINKCPVVAATSVLNAENLERLKIEPELYRRNREKLIGKPELAEKIQAVFSEPKINETSDPDLMLYSGGFFSPRDRMSMDRLVEAHPDTLADSAISFVDSRLEEMLFRYRGRHYPETLDAEDRAAWLQYCRDRLSGQLHPDGRQALTFSGFRQALQEAESEVAGDSRKEGLLRQLSDYSLQLQQELQCNTE